MVDRNGAVLRRSQRSSDDPAAAANEHQFIAIETASEQENRLRRACRSDSLNANAVRRRRA
jgi:hypothetical protein